MTITDKSADSARPDDRERADIMNAHLAAVLREYAEKRKVRVLHRTRTTQDERDAWMLESMERQIAENNEKARLAAMNSQSAKCEPVADRNHVYPEWAERRYQGD